MFFLLFVFDAVAPPIALTSATIACGFNDVTISSLTFNAGSTIRVTGVSTLTIPGTPALLNSGTIATFTGLAVVFSGPVALAGTFE